MALLLLVLVVALVFEFVNGFHDTANSVAAVVGSRVLTPTQAIALAAVTNLCGALAGVAVATTMGKGLVDVHSVTSTTLICALLGAVAWNLLTWRLGATVLRPIHFETGPDSRRGFGFSGSGDAGKHHNQSTGPGNRGAA